MLNTSRVVLYSEPLFYNMTLQFGNWNPHMLPLYGWHKRKMTDSVAYVDGSARSTLCVAVAQLDPDMLKAINFWHGYYHYANWFLRRGDKWQTDTYPTVGSRIPIKTPAGYIITPTPESQGFFGWPFDGYYDVR